VRLVLLACLLAASTAAAETRPRYGGTVEGTLLGAPATLDPLAAKTHAEVTVAGLLFDTLYRLDGQPHVADGEPVLDEKRTTVRIAIKKGVRMHDGTELTAFDVAASLERARLHAKWVLPALVGVKQDGDGVVLSLRAPVPELTTLLALPQLAVTKAGRAPGDKPIGSGPFMLDAFDRRSRRIVLRAFDDHFAGRPYVDLLALAWFDTPDAEARRFETGKSQFSARGAAAFAGGQPAYRSVDLDGPPALLLFVGFGRAHADVTGDRGFRRALDLALGRGALTTIGTGERVVPTRMPLPVEAGGAALDAAARAGEIDKARRELGDAGRRAARVKLEILVEDTRPDDREIGERVALALDKLGIAAVVTPLSAQTMRDRVARGQCDLWIGQIAEPLTSALAWWNAAFAAGNDDAPVMQPQLDFAKAFAERLPIVPLMFRSIRMWHPTNVRGMSFDASGRPGYADVFVFGGPTATRKARP
jgi:peptide/nickel transport system substrate-binding protein